MVFPSPSVITDVKAVFAGPVDKMMYLKNDGTLWAGGNNDFGMLGTGFMQHIRPYQVNTIYVKGAIQEVEMGAYHSMIDQLNEYSARFGVKVTIDTKPFD